MSGIDHIAVVIPARDEGELIGRCLRSIAIARRRVRSDVTVSVLVIADGCRDDTTERGRAAAADVLEVAGIGVGAARARGVAHVLASTAVASDRLWIANTDADSSAGRNWLADQLIAAESGADVRLGSVRPRFSDLNSLQLDVWRSRHAGGRARGHIHGANLGVRANRYLEVGGFRPLLEHEDVDLVRRLRATDARFLSAGNADIITSGRSVGRTPGGYAGYLRTIAFAAE